MTQSTEDYLEMISFLADSGAVRVTDIAARLGFSKPSVHAALKSLEADGFVERSRYGPIKLTEKGGELAGEVRKRHNIIKKFLQEALEISDETAEKDACKMEHVLSRETLAKMENYGRRNE